MNPGSISTNVWKLRHQDRGTWQMGKEGGPFQWLVQRQLLIHGEMNNLILISHHAQK